MFTWERNWRSSGIAFVLVFIIASLIYGTPPEAGASADTVVSFYDGDRTRVLIATVFFGLALVNLFWFAAAIASVLRDAGLGGWGLTAIAACGAFVAVSFVLVTVNAALAYSIAGSGNDTLTTGVNDLAWAFFVMASFPAATLIMAGSFGLWRAGVISNGLFGAGVAAVLLTLLAGTTWASDGIWAPDGVYSQYVSPAIRLAWIAVFSALLSARSPSTTRAPERAAVPVQ